VQAEPRSARLRTAIVAEDGSNRGETCKMLDIYPPWDFPGVRY
jgi:hypothetical protein